MQSLNIGLSGSQGRMGKSIQTLVESTSSFKINCLLNKKDSIKGWSPESIDVVIDFSSPACFEQVLKWCVDHKKPLVSGTTGLNEALVKKMKAGALSIPILWSANMSLGIAWLNSCLKKVPQSIKEWDIQIQEIHHSQKKDSPSGTALMFQNTLKSINASPSHPVSIRGGGVHGVHKVFFMGEEEICSLEHIAQDRKVFARGALKASTWIGRQPAGLYSIENCL